MSMDPELIPRPATALIAMVRSMAMQDQVDDAEVARLVDAVAGSRAERTAVLAALRQANDAELGLLIADLLAAHVSELRDREEGLKDLDDVVGVWSQRLTAGALLAGAGAAVTGTLGGGAALAAILLPMIGGAGISAGRLYSRSRKNTLARRREEAETLGRHVLEIARKH